MMMTAAAGVVAAKATGVAVVAGATKTIVIDSRDAVPSSSSSPTAYTIQLPETLYDVRCARLMSAEIPASFYVFSSDRANVELTLVRNGTPVTVAIPDGNYGLTDMLETLSSALTAACDGVAITVTAPKNTLRCAISSAVPTDVLGVDTRSLSSSASTNWGLAYYLGFDRDVLLTTGTHTVRAPRVCMLNPELSMYVDIEELGTIIESRTEGQGGTVSRRAFAKIPINADSFQYVYFDKQLTAHTYTPPIAVLTKLRLAWRFHTGEPVDFHGVHHSLTLQLECNATSTRANQ